jgi:hypothetical protein
VSRPKKPKKEIPIVEEKPPKGEVEITFIPKLPKPRKRDPGSPE